MQKGVKYICFFSSLILFIILFAISIAYGQHTQKSYIDDASFHDLLKNEQLRVLYYHYPFDKQYDIYGERQDADSLQDIEADSDLVVKVRLQSHSERQIYEECILSQVQVIKQYKGNVPEGDMLSVFEPVNCTGIKGMLLCSEGYSPMEEGQEYLLFLKQLKNSLFGKNPFVYLPSTLTFSKYAVKQGSLHVLPEKDLETKGLLYSQVLGKEVFLYDKAMFKVFSKIKEQALSKYD